MNDEDREELRRAHQEVDAIMGAQQFNALRKAMGLLTPQQTAEEQAVDPLVKAGDSLARFRAAAGKASGTVSNDATRKGRDNSEAGAAITAARARSKPGDTGDQYSDVGTSYPDDGDDVDDQGEEDEGEDREDEMSVKPMRRSFAATDVYDTLIKSDATGGDIVRTIDATEALELMTSTFAKSLGQVSTGLAQNDARLDARIEQLEKGLGALADGLAALIGHVAQGGPLTKSTAGQGQTPTGAAANLGAALEDQMVARFGAMPGHATNTPGFFGAGVELPEADKLSKAGAPAVANYDSLEGRQFVEGALRKGVEQGIISSGIIGDLDFDMPSAVVAKVPAHVRSQIGL